MTPAENEDWHPERREPSDGLPGLPPEWGRIVVPDDPAALAAEAEAVRRELRERAAGPERAAGRPAGDRLTDPTAADPRPLRYAPTAAVPRLPLLVLAIAVLATLASFLAAMWPGQSRPSPGQARETAGRRTVPLDPAGRAVPALDLVDETGSTVALRSLLPAVILLVEECDCPATVTTAASTVPSGVTVVALFSGVPALNPPAAVLPPGAARVRSLADPAGGLRRFLRVPARPGEVATLLVDRSGQVVRFLANPASAGDYQADLSRLAPA